MFLCHYAVGLAAKKWVPQGVFGHTLSGFGLAGFALGGFLFLLLGWESVKIMPGVTKVLPAVEFTDYSLSHSFGVGLMKRLEPVCSASFP